MKLRCPHVTGRRTLGSMLMLTFLTAPAIAQRGLPYRIDPPPGSVFFGGSVLSGGDADNDGYEDVFIIDHAYAENGIILGRSFMYSGRTGSEMWRVVGSQALEFTPTTLCAAFIGDIDGDHCDDVVLGQPWADGRRGRVDVYSGRTGAPLFAFTGENPEDRLGRDVSGVGDVDGDTVPDFAFVRRWSQEGALSIHSGSTGGVIHEIDHAWPRRIRSAADIDGDDRPDIAVGIWKGMGLGIVVYSGRDASVIHDLARPDPDDESFGWALAGGHDLNGDDIPDLVASGTTDRARAPRAYLIDGRTGSPSPIVSVPSTGNLFAYAIDVDDVNGDGSIDAVISDTHALTVFNAQTGVSLHWDPAARLGTAALYGMEVAVGDVNGDGAADFITQHFIDTGGVMIRAGAPTLLHPADPAWNRVRSRSFDIQAYTGEPGRVIHFFASRRGTSCTFVPRLNICIDLLRPLVRIGQAVTDATGVATLSLDPSSTASGPVWLQALDPGDPARPAITSNVLEIEILD